MKYSIIISYRDREQHLSKLLPRLYSIFEGIDYEIIIVEQDDDDKFQKNSLYNIAGIRANGEILIFHDVDYYPSDNVNIDTYTTEKNEPLYPVGRVIFLNENDVPRDSIDIPYGYRNFHMSVGDHSGGVFVLHKDLFHSINGLNPYYRGWGKEDDDTRERLRIFGKNWNRNTDALFYALYHKDSKPPDDDTDFINNHIMLSQIEKNTKFGYNHVKAKIEEFDSDNNIRWLKVKDLKYQEI